MYTINLKKNSLDKKMVIFFFYIKTYLKNKLSNLIISVILDNKFFHLNNYNIFNLDHRNKN